MIKYKLFARRLWENPSRKTTRSGGRYHCVGYDTVDNIHEKPAFPDRFLDECLSGRVVLRALAVE